MNLTDLYGQNSKHYLVYQVEKLPLFFFETYQYSVQKRFILHKSDFWTSYYWPISCVRESPFPWISGCYWRWLSKKSWTKSRAQMKLLTDSPLLLVQYCQPKNSRLLMQRGTGTKRQAGGCLLFVDSPAWKKIHYRPTGWVHTYPDMYKVTSPNHRFRQFLGGSIPLSVRHKHNSCLLFAPVGSSGHQRTQWI